MSLGAGFGQVGPGGGDKSLKFTLADTFRLAWADPDLKARILYILGMFAVYALCVHVPVPIPGVSAAEIEELVKSNQLFNLLNVFGGRALQRISILALGLNPYITASIIMQIMTAATPAWKKELQEGGEYARKAQNKRTRLLSIGLCIAQGWGLLSVLKAAPSIATAMTPMVQFTTILFWTTGSMFLMWIGERLSEKGIGNGMSLLIFAGIVIAFPGTIQLVYEASFVNKTSNPINLFLVLGLFVLATYFVTYFTIAQRRIPIQHVRRQFGTKAMGGGSSYLPFSVVMVGVIPIIFAFSLLTLPQMFANMFPKDSSAHNALLKVSEFIYPNFQKPEGYIGIVFFMLLIFFFTYFYTAIQFNVEDIANNLKRAGSFIPGVRPGKQTKDFLDAVISRITILGAFFLSVVSLSQFLVPVFINVASVGWLFGTSLLIMVSVALETMRQIEANLLMKQYGQ